MRNTIPEKESEVGVDLICHFSVTFLRSWGFTS